MRPAQDERDPAVRSLRASVAPVRDVVAEPSPGPPRGALGRLLRPVRRALLIAGACQALAAVAGLVPFVAVAEIARELLGAGAADDARVWVITAVAGGALVARVVLLFAAVGIAHFADHNFQLHTQRRLVDRLGRVPLGWFSERTGGEVKKAVADDVAAMHHVVAHSLNDIVAAVVTPVAALAYMFWVDWRFTLVAMIPLVVGLWLYSRQMSGYGEKLGGYNEALGDVNSAAVEFVQGIAVVKAFGRVGRAHGRFIAATNRFVDYFWDWVKGLLRIAAASDVVLAPLTGLLVVSVAGAGFVAGGWMTPLELVPFYLLGLAIGAPILSLSFAANEMQEATLAAGRVVALAEAPTLPVSEKPRSPEGRRVEYRGVCFSYDGAREVLSDIDLTLEPNTVTALVGPSGGGKSTAAKLLCRFWDPTEGSITLGGVDLRDIHPGELYRHVGFVFQDTQLLRAGVAENIRLGRADASDAEVEAAARGAQIHERIVALPDGYDTVIGVEAQLSAGEAQRVAIARALLADTPIVVLDEATAFADPESEAAIQDALSSLVAGRTLLVIAHRLSTVTNADQIAVIDRGRLAEVGRHAELLDGGGLYLRLWVAHERLAG